MKTCQLHYFRNKLSLGTFNEMAEYQAPYAKVTHVQKIIAVKEKASVIEH
jgi:hypothetical protein